MINLLHQKYKKKNFKELLELAKEKENVLIRTLQNDNVSLGRSFHFQYTLEQSTALGSPCKGMFRGRVRDNY